MTHLRLGAPSLDDCLVEGVPHVAEAIAHHGPENSRKTKTLHICTVDADKPHTAFGDTLVRTNDTGR